jgi:DNA adenine methylase
LSTESGIDVLESLNRRGVPWALSFDGRRGGKDFTCDLPRGMYRRHLLLSSGNSAVGKVLNGPVERVEESLYLNY